MAVAVSELGLSPIRLSLGHEVPALDGLVFGEKTSEDRFLDPAKTFEALKTDRRGPILDILGKQVNRFSTRAIVDGVRSGLIKGHPNSSEDEHFQIESVQDLMAESRAIDQFIGKAKEEGLFDGDENATQVAETILRTARQNSSYRRRDQTVIDPVEEIKVLYDDSRHCRPLH